MPDDETIVSDVTTSTMTTDGTGDGPASSAPVRRTRRRSASRPAGPPEHHAEESADLQSPASVAAGPAVADSTDSADTAAARATALTADVPGSAPPQPATTADRPTKATSRRRRGAAADVAPSSAGASAAGPSTSAEAAASPAPDVHDEPARGRSADVVEEAETAAEPTQRASSRRRKPAVSDPFAAADSGVAPSRGDRPAGPVSTPIFQAPDAAIAPQPQPSPSPAGSARSEGSAPSEGAGDRSADGVDGASGEAGTDQRSSEDQPTSGSSRRRRSRGGRSRRKASDATGSTSDGEPGDTSESPEGSATSTRTDTTPAADAGETGSNDGKATGGGSKGDQAKGDQAQSGQRKTSRAKGDQVKGAQAKGDRTKGDETEAADADGSAGGRDEVTSGDEGAGSTSSSSRRRRRRRRGSDGGSDNGGQPAADAKKSDSKSAGESIASVEGSTRIEAKKQRRREGREAGRRRAPILSESEFLARRESVDRVMVVRQRGEVTQIAVLEDEVLVEHYIAHEQQSSLIGNVYLGRVQNVLPSMEAAFIDIGKGRNAVLYAGEVNWDLVGDRNKPRRIENALKSGQQVLVQVSKDPVGHKGARLTSQISLPGRYLVYVPSGGSSGISRKLPDTERNRLKNLLKDILPEEAGVIIRTAAEGAAEEELRRDVTRLTARWEEIQKSTKGGKAPALLYAEPDITLKVVRDLFTEDFGKLVVSGQQAWDTVHDYVDYVAPDLMERLERWDDDSDVFERYRVDEQIAKALERKVWLPSGGSLVIDRTEAMTVVDVNTGKFTGSGGNLEQTVTKNNLEAAEEIVRQLRLRDIGGIIVIDFIDMVLENNRDLVLRRLVECLGRDRTRHQVAEVTSLGLVQMTRKRIGTGLLEAFSVPCETCHGRGVVIETEPVKATSDDSAHSHTRSASKHSGSRQRSSSKSSKEAERLEAQAVERHSAAAAATAVIAAALSSGPKAGGGDAGSEAGPETPGISEPVTTAPDASPTSQETVAAEAAERPKAGDAAVPTTKKAATRKTASKRATTKKATTKAATKKAPPAKAARGRKAAAEPAQAAADAPPTS